MSSNIGTAKLTARLGARRLVDGVRRFGFGRTTGSGFPGEVAGSVREIREKQAIERANLSFGQGVTVTPIQLVTAMAVFANDGRARDSAHHARERRTRPTSPASAYSPSAPPRSCSR